MAALAWYISVPKFTYWNNSADQIGGRPWKEGGGPLCKLLLPKVVHKRCLLNSFIMPNVHARKHDILPIPLKCDFVVFEPAVQTQSVKSKSVLRLNGIKWVKFPSGQTVSESEKIRKK